MCKLSNKTPKLNENRGNLEFFGNRGFGIFMEIGRGNGCNMHIGLGGMDAPESTIVILEIPNVLRKS